MRLGKQLLVTLVDSGTTALQTRYAMVRGGTVLSEGECAPGDLPYAPEARAAFFSRSGYFDRVETEVRNAHTLPFQARRIIEGALVFHEAFKTRFAASEVSSGRYRLNLTAVADADIRAVLETLPTTNVPFSRLVLAETAIAALINMETDEPAGVLWMRAGVIVGLLVEKGVVLARVMDRPTAVAGGELGSRLERVSGSVAAAARRLFPAREVTLSLALGELVGKGTAAQKTDAPSRTFEARLARRFPGVGENNVLVWPELYGLATVPACYSLLDPGYQEEAQVSRYATWVGGALLACGVAATAAAFWQYLDWQQTQAAFASRNAKLDADYASVKQKLPSPEQLAALQQRQNKLPGETDFRVDAFLAWVSRLTPEGALIRSLGVTGDAAPTAPDQPASTPSAPLAPVVTIEWEVQGDYAGVEQLTADLLLKLGARTHLSNSKLEYKPGGNARFTTVLAPLAGAFKE
jgi:hypothetical protein